MNKIFSLFITTVLASAILVTCTESPAKSPIQNRDPNGTSELQMTMRHMYDYFEEVKVQLDAGKKVDEIKAFEHLLSDTPTETGKNKTAIYKALAQNYLFAIDNMNTRKDKESFKLIVDACMSCHQKVCPGPMVKIKKLYDSE